MNNIANLGFFPPVLIVSVEVTVAQCEMDHLPVSHFKLPSYQQPQNQTTKAFENEVNRLTNNMSVTSADTLYQESPLWQCHPKSDFF